MMNCLNGGIPNPAEKLRLISRYKTMTYLSKLLLVFLVLLLSFSERSLCQVQLIDCDNEINCINHDEWTVVNGATHDLGDCQITVDFRYTKCNPLGEYIIDILNVKANIGCPEPDEVLMNEAIKLSFVKLDEMNDSLWSPNQLNVFVKSYTCYLLDTTGIEKVVSPCSGGCCLSRYTLRKEVDRYVVEIRIPYIENDPTENCMVGCQPYSCINTHFMVSEIYFSDYLDDICEEQCYWRLNGNNIINPNNFIGPTNGEDFVIKTKNTAGFLNERIRVSNDNRIDFNLNSWHQMPRISFDSPNTGTTLGGDPIIKMYRPTGTGIDPYPTFPWWISVGANGALPEQPSGAFNIWSGPYGALAGQETVENGMTRRFTILPNGNVGIGVVNPATELVVAGTICAEEVRVALSGLPCWPDYVFADNYKLTSIDELEKFIKSNKHLPGIPNAEDVANNGVELGDMQARMLQKIEELTLYIIELKKENEEIKKMVNTKKE